MMDPIRRKMLKTGAAATVMAAAPRVLAQQAGQKRGGVRLLLRRRARSHSVPGDRLGVPVVAHCGRRPELDDRRSHEPVQRDRGIQGRVPLCRVGFAQREHRPVLGSAGDRPAVGCLHR